MANVNIPIGQLPVAISLSGSEVLALDQGGTTKQATVRQVGNAVVTSNFPAAIEFVIDSGGANMSTGVKGYMEAPFAATVDYIDVYGDQTGSCSIDIWRCTNDQFDAGITHPVAADSICDPNYPTITLGTKTRLLLPPAVGTSLAAGDVLAFYVRSVSTFLRLTISIKLARTIG